MKHFLAVDLGATSGRTILSSVEAGKVVMREYTRFRNPQIPFAGHLYWDLPQLFNEILEALRKLAAEGRRPARGAPLLLSRHPHRRRHGALLRRVSAARGGLSQDGHPVYALQLSLPVLRHRPRRRLLCRRSLGGVHPRRAGLYAHRPHGVRIHRGLHLPAAQPRHGRP